MALLAEGKAVELFQLFKPVGFVDEGFNDFHNKFYKKAISLNETAFSIMATGTLVWGFGDLFIAWLELG